MRGISALARMLCSPLSTCGERKLIFDLTRSLAGAVENLYRQTLRTSPGTLCGNVDVSLEVRVLVDGREQSRRRDVIAEVNRDIADDAGKRSANFVVGELLLLGVSQRRIGLVVPLGVLIGLSRLIVRVARDDTCFEELALALNLDMGVIVEQPSSAPEFPAATEPWPPASADQCASGPARP